MMQHIVQKIDTIYVCRSVAGEYSVPYLAAALPVTRGRESDRTLINLVAFYPSLCYVITMALNICLVVDGIRREP
jgi:hypothetical protein